MAPAKPLVLVVDDSPDDIDMLETAFAEIGFELFVERVGDGESALTRLLGRRRGRLPELVVLDVKLPKMDGMTLLRRLRAEPATRGLVIGILTSMGVDHDRAEAERLGSAYLVKPSDFDALVGVAKVLRDLLRDRAEPQPSAKPATKSLGQ